jgi:hypothetical protein
MGAPREMPGWLAYCDIRIHPLGAAERVWHARRVSQAGPVPRAVRLP